MKFHIRQALAMTAAAVLLCTSVVPAVYASGIDGNNIPDTTTGTSRPQVWQGDDGHFYSDSIIKHNQTGSITVHKIIENDGKVVQADGHALPTNNLDTTENHQKLDVTSPDRAEGAETFNDSENSNPATFSGSTDGTTNGNTVLEGGQDATGHTDSKRDNETYDGDENAQALMVPDIGFSYIKVGDLVSVASHVKRVPADGTDETTPTQVDTENGNYTGVGLYYTNIESGFLDIGADFGITLKATEMTTADSLTTTSEDGEIAYYTTSAVENYLTQIQNAGRLENEDSIYNNMTGSEALTAYTKYVKDTKATDQAVQSDDKTAGDFALTDANGEATVSGLPIGLYLVGETDITRHDGLDDNGNPIGRDEDTVDAEAPIISAPCKPFLVSIPSTNVAVVTEGETQHEPGTVWEYDMNVYPKNQTTAVNKAILDPDENYEDIQAGGDGGKTLRTREDFQIGDVINQVIWADAPVPQQSFNITADTDDDSENTPYKKNNYLRYRLSDTMTPSLSFDAVTDVYIVKKVANPTKDTSFRGADGKMLDELDPVYLIPGTDYIVESKKNAGEADDAGFTETDLKGRDIHAFTIALTTEGLAKLNAITQDSQVIAFFDATLNKDAMIGPTDAGDVQDTAANPDTVTDYNMNYPELNYDDEFYSEKTVKGNKVYVFTHEVDIKKDGLSDPTQAGFVVTRKNDQNDAATNPTNMKNVTEGSRMSTTDTTDQTKQTYLTQDARSTVTLPTMSNYYFGEEAFSTQKLVEGIGHMAFVKEAEGVYHLYDNSLDDGKATSGYGNDRMFIEEIGKHTGTGNVGDIVTVLHPNADGKLFVKGLDSVDEYTLKEVETQTGHNLMKDPFTVVLQEVAPRPTSDKKAPEDDTDIWKDGRLISYDQNEMTTDADGNEIEDAGKIAKSIDHGSYVRIGNDGIDIFGIQGIVSRMTGDNIAALTINSQNAGIAEFEVDNYKTVILYTGGTGRTIIYVIGGGLAALLVVLYVVSKKKKNAYIR